MHREAYDYVRRVAAGLPLEGATVVEIGSYNVNGGVRLLFGAAARYIGVDARPGPGVDVVGHFADLGITGADVVVSTEALEHDPRPAETVAAAWRALRPGGLLVITTAAPERAPHSCDGHTWVPAGEHYGNISPDDLRAWLEAEGDEVQVEHAPERGDVYAAARKR